MVRGYGLKWIGTVSFLMWPTTLSIFFPPSLYNKIWGRCTWTLFLFDPLEAWSLMEWPYLVNHMVLNLRCWINNINFFLKLSLLKPIGTTHSCIILNFMGSNKRNTIAKFGCLSWRNTWHPSTFALVPCSKFHTKIEQPTFLWSIGSHWSIISSMHMFLITFHVGYIEILANFVTFMFISFDNFFTIHERISQ